MNTGCNSTPLEPYEVFADDSNLGLLGSAGLKRRARPAQQVR